MVPHRGSTIYLPIIVPENIQLLISLLCGAVAFVLLLVSIATTNWITLSGHIPPHAARRGIDFTLTFGLRTAHIRYCEDLSSVYNHNAQSKRICASENIYYSECTDEVQNSFHWCRYAKSPLPAFLLILAADIGLVFSTIFALSKRLFQPVGYSLCVIACSVALIYFRFCLLTFEPAGILREWIGDSSDPAIQNNRIEVYSGYSYIIMMSATLLLLLGLFMSSWGVYRVARSTTETAPHTAAENVEDGTTDSNREGNTEGVRMEDIPRDGDVIGAVKRPPKVAEQKEEANTNNSETTGAQNKDSAV